ncbi:MAG: elongation factor Ts [Clostridia bacterium]|nr:elongation factor Ts [Clostridia bacterium]
MAFTAKDVQALREKTGAGMMDCKKALVETDGDMDKAVDFLREKGLAAAAKKASRVAAEGTVAAYCDANAGALVEINCETDFVAKGAPFIALAKTVVETVAATKPADVDALLATKALGSDKTVEEEVQEVFLALRENMKVRRFAVVEGHTATYIHAGGSVGVIVAFDTDDATAAKDEFAAMGKNVAMQVAAMNPAYLDDASVPAEVLEKEKGILIAQMKEDPKMANKPEQVLAKIVEGKVGKFYKENCLVNQDFVRSDLFDGNVSGYVASVAKALGADIKLKSFVRFEKGEGIQKREDNFADEVASMM